MKRFKILGLLGLVFFLLNYDVLQNNTIINTTVKKSLKFHHFNLTNFSFIHSSDWHYSIHKKNSNIYKMLNNYIPIKFHFVTGDLVDSKSKDGIQSHQYEFEENQVKQIVYSYKEKYQQMYSDFKGFYSVLGNHDIYDTLERQKERLHHVINTQYVKIIMLDTGPFGMGRPLNFFGFIDSLVIEIIEMSLGEKPLIIMAHYPLSTTFYSKKLLDLLRNYKYPVYYLCGHLHYLKKPFGYHLKTLYNGLIELEVGDTKDHHASRLFHISKRGISWTDLNNENYTNAIITWPLDHKYLINVNTTWDHCVEINNYGAKKLELFGDDQSLFVIENAVNQQYSRCLEKTSYRSLKLVSTGIGQHVHQIYLQQIPFTELPTIERVMYWLYSLNYADAFINMFYLFYFIQILFLLSLFFGKGKYDTNWFTISALKYTYSKVWIVFNVTSISFLFMPIFYGSFAKDNNRCSVIESPFYPFGTRYNNQDVFQFDFLIWITLFLYYENFILLMGYHVHIFRHKIKNTWIPVIIPSLIFYIKFRLLWNMFVWYVYEDRDCFNTDWLFFAWNSFGFLQLLVMPVSWVFLRYVHLLITNKLSLGFRPKDL
eukprot:NODE_381_length_8377_cov_0.385238.p2 type:complete len:597 gc:universal NODE_381_length_8377_cov_0.385238:503-2293(+)